MSRKEEKKVVTAPSLNSFKSRLNKCWKGHPYKIRAMVLHPGRKNQMEKLPEKRLQRSSDKHIQFDYTLHQKRFEQVQSAKYLGLTFTDDLDWGQHISKISAKATKTMCFLWHNLAFAPRHTKEVAYKTLVRPKFEYAAPIWHPYHKSQIGQVEKVQRTAARLTCRRWRNTSSVGDMLDDLEETRREQSSLTFFYKIHSGTVSLDKDKYLTPAPNLRRTRASHESQYTRYFALNHHHHHHHPVEGLKSTNGMSKTLRKICAAQ